MKKQSTKPQQSVGETAEPSHLEDTLTSAVRSSARFVKTYRIPLLALLVCLVAFFVARAILQEAKESKLTALNERIYVLFDAPSVEDPSYVPPREEVEDLLSQVSGTEVERIALKAAGDYYLGRGEEVEKDLERAEKGSEVPGGEASKPSTPPEELKKKRDEYFDRAVQIATDAAARYGDDLDVQQWSTALRARVDGIRDPNWLPSGRTYAPKEPGDDDDGATAPQSPGAAAEPQGGAQEAAAPPGGPTPSEGPSAPPEEPPAGEPSS